MRKTLLFLLLLSVKLTFGQFYDDFSDGNFTLNPPWVGQASLFNINTSKQLQSSLTSVSQTVSLSTANALALNVKWECTVQMNFDPSATNLARIYLIADQQDVKGSLNGYFIQIGESGSADSYDLYRQTGATITKIIDGPAKNRANINYLSTKLRVTRDGFGHWELYVAVDGLTNYTLEGNATDLTFTTTNWFGVYCKYTATRTDGFFFDDFKVEEFVAGVKPYLALKGDLVINEIFADPSPPVGLPIAEFVEIWNTSNQYIPLNGWKYADLTSTYIFGADTIKPNEYIIICARADVDLFKSFAKTIGLNSWPSLNNDKDKLSLVSPQNVLIDEVFYTDFWYKDAVKKQGGYSLELIDPKNKCGGIQNWQASNQSIGGTPGTENSVYKSQLTAEIPKLLTATIIDSITIKLVFNKYVDSLPASLIGNYNLNNGIGQPLAALPQSPEFTSVLLQLSSPLPKGIECTITITDVTDCAGNLISSFANSAKIFLAKDANQHDILISEILVNPKSGGVDFIEVYNNTDHVLDLMTLKLANADASGKASNIKNVSAVSVYLPSKSYWILTSNNEVIKQQYFVKNPNNFTKMAVLPSYNNDKGTVILLNAAGIIDRFDYNEKMHFPLLQSADGVSLERVSFQRLANEPGNFISAAQVTGFATPSYKNAQAENETSNNGVWLNHKVFSPDGNGFEDLLQIDYQFASGSILANVNIYTDKGILVKKLLRNSNIGNHGYLMWDGLNDAGQLNKTGIYVIQFDTFTLSGKIQRFKQSCVLAARLN